MIEKQKLKFQTNKNTDYAALLYTINGNKLIFQIFSHLFRLMHS